MTLPNELSVNIGLPQNPITQNPELFSELKRVYNAISQVARAVDFYTGVLPEEPAYWDQIGMQRFTFGLNSRLYLEAGEGLEYGQLVGINATGKVIKALDGTTFCMGFCNAPDGTLIGETTEVKIIGMFPRFPAATLTGGTKYYLSDTVAGQLTVVAGTQFIGYALNDTQLLFNPCLCDPYVPPPPPPPPDSGS